MTDTAITSWFTGRLPDEWTSAAAPTIVTDRDEITVTVAIESPEPETETSGTDPSGTDTSAADRSEMVAGRIAAFREDTRERRMTIAREAEHRFERKVAWAVRVDDTVALFSHLAAPAMTRLRQPERMVLDTLVAANIARSRSDALAWCVRLVGRNVDEWLADLRDAMRAVDEVRAAGPEV